VERGVAAEDDLEDHSQTPDVAAVVVLAGHHLGRDLVGRAGLGGQDVCAHLEVFGQAEVDQFDVPGLLLDGHEVFGFEVAVHDVALVAVVDGAHDGVEERAALGFVELTELHDAVEEFSALEQLHHHLDALCVLIPLEQFHNVWVVQLAQNLEFQLQTRYVFHAALWNDFAGALFLLVRLQNSLDHTPIGALS